MEAVCGREKSGGSVNKVSEEKTKEQEVGDVTDVADGLGRPTEEDSLEIFSMFILCTQTMTSLRHTTTLFNFIHSLKYANDL